MLGNRVFCVVLKKCKQLEGSFAQGKLHKPRFFKETGEVTGEEA